MAASIARSCALLVVGLLLAFAAPEPAGSGSGDAELVAARQPAAGDGYDYVAQCLAERKRLLVLALIDESASLDDTDVGNRRVDALNAALGTLARFGRGPANSDGPELEVLLASFGERFAARGPWSVLNTDTEPALRQRIGEFGELDDKVDTDFAAALDGARQALRDKEAEQAGAGAAPPCRLVLLFTDGEYDIQSRAGQPKPYAPQIPLRDDRAVEDAGRAFLCTGDGVADQLRQAETVVMAVALLPDPPTRRPDQQFLRTVAEGPGTAPGCGQRSSPPGVYLPADGINGLVSAFDDAITRALGYTPEGGPSDVGVCQEASVGPQCTRTFDVDAALSEFHILVDLRSPGIVADISGPGVGPQRLRANEPARFPMSGAAVQVTPAAQTNLVIDAALDPAETAWDGVWTIRFIDESATNAGQVARAQITLFGGLTPGVEPVPTFQVGERADFEIVVRDVARAPRTPEGFVRSAVVSAAVVGPEGPQPLSVAGARTGGPYRTGYDLPAGTTASTLDLRLTLEVTTRSGITLRPKVVTYPIAVAPPAGHPAVAPVELRLQPIIDSGLATGTLTVTGTAGPGGCAWFTPAFPDGPRDAGAIAVTFDPPATDQNSCIAVAPGETRTLAVSAGPQQVRNGLVEGAIQVSTTGGGPQVRTAELPTRFEMEQTPNRPVQIVVLIALLVAGILVPLALLWLLSWLGSRFPWPGSQLKRIRVPVRVTQGAVNATDPRDAAVVLPPALDWQHPPAPTEPCRTFSDDPLRFRVVVPWFPLRLPYGEVRAGGRHVFTADGSGMDRGGLRSGRVPLALGQTWVFVADGVESDDDGEAVVGEIFLYVTDLDIDLKGQRVLSRIERDLPGVVMPAAKDLPRYAGIATAEDDGTFGDEPDDFDDGFHTPSTRRRR